MVLQVYPDPNSDQDAPVRNQHDPQSKTKYIVFHFLPAHIILIVLEPFFMCIIVCMSTGWSQADASDPGWRPHDQYNFEKCSAEKFGISKYGYILCHIIIYALN